MTFGKAAALTAGFVGAVALGVAIGPSITDRLSDRDHRATVSQAPASSAAQPDAVSERTSRARATDPTDRRAAVKEGVKAEKPVAIAVNPVRADEPRVQARLKPVLNRGTKMDVAAEGFLTAEEFATVAHAAKNTNVPFMVLKHRVLNEKRPFEDTMADAIREFKPQLNADAEVAKAQREAREDLADISGN